jgi:hypothetical protein
VTDASLLRARARSGVSFPDYLAARRCAIPFDQQAPCVALIADRKVVARKAGKRTLGDVAPLLEHDPEKWMPVFRKDHAPTKKLDHDPILFDRIMV